MSSEHFRRHLDIIIVIALYVMAAVLLVIAAVWIFHILIPQWGWLSKDQLGVIQSIATGSALVRIISDQFKKRIN